MGGAREALSFRPRWRPVCMMDRLPTSFCKDSVVGVMGRLSAHCKALDVGARRCGLSLAEISRVWYLIFRTFQVSRGATVIAVIVNRDTLLSCAGCASGCR